MVNVTVCPQFCTKMKKWPLFPSMALSLYFQSLNPRMPYPFIRVWLHDFFCPSYSMFYHFLHKSWFWKNHIFPHLQPQFFFTFLLYLYQKSAFANAVFRLCCHVSFKLFCCMIFSICAQNKWTDCLFTKRSSLGKFMSSAICSIYPYSVNVNRFPNHLLLRSHGL